MTDSAGSFARRRHGTLVPVRTFGNGRVCSAEGCSTVLSLYNPSDLCAVHERHVTHVEEEPSRRLLGPLLVAQCAFSECDNTFATRNPRRKYCSDSCRMKAFQRRERADRERDERELRAA